MSARSMKGVGRLHLLTQRPQAHGILHIAYCISHQLERDRLMQDVDNTVGGLFTAFMLYNEREKDRSCIYPPHTTQAIQIAQQQHEKTRESPFFVLLVILGCVYSRPGYK